MDISLFADIQPTWETVAFDEGIDRIPSSGDRYSSTTNPLDNRVAICFRLAQRGYLCYAPLTDTSVIVEEYPNCSELTKLLHCKISYICCVADNVRSCLRYFLHTMVIGESLVFRKFRFKVTYARIDDDTYKCTTFPVKEVCRYVLGKYGLIIEKTDKSYAFVTTDKLPSNDIYDTLKDANRQQIYDLYTGIVAQVKLQHKEDILRTLNRMEKSFYQISFKLLKTLYVKANERYNNEGDVPKAIRQELDTRKHRLNIAVRIDKNLMVVTGIKHNRHPEGDEQTRIYFGSERAYYFIKNSVTDEWHNEDLYKAVFSNPEMRKRIVEKDLFDGTCMENHAGFAAKLWEPRCNRVSLGILMAISGFLCAEQAVKMNKLLFNLILENIYDGLIVDGKMTLPEVLGMTGPQIKYLDQIRIPRNLKQYGECMSSQDFIKHFPDVKKRAFAVAFYLNHRSHWASASDLTREEVFDSARTLNSIERAASEKRDRMLDEYRDYLTMYSRYRTYMTEMEESVPLVHELIAFGEMPVNMKPSKIHDYHDKMSRIIGLIRCADQIANYSDLIERRKSEEARKREYSDGRYSILMPGSAEEIIEEGRYLCHCVGTAGYIEAMAAKRCTILFLRNNDRIAKPLITIEERDGAIRQCYGFRDTYNTDENIRDFIQAYAADHELRIEARIYSETEK